MPKTAEARFATVPGEMLMTTIAMPTTSAVRRPDSDPNPQVVRGVWQLIWRQVHFAGEKIEVPTP
ncbi:hypothetical protein, partial [Streptomyces sp. NPDC057428]|uniref:hypothetical protein n=1 Tax=Streptomyces sp. NPDC057428 TaxID=3346129 RepID=UPI00367EE484